MHLRVIAGVAAFLLAGFIVSYVIVNIAMFKKFFARADSDKLKARALEDAHYAPFREEILANYTELEKLPAERVFCVSYDGTRLSARYYDSGSKKTVVLLHGYHAVPWINFAASGKGLIERKYNILLIDQRASGQSGGKYSSMGVCESKDLLCWIEYLQREKQPESIALYGISMGAATVGYVSDSLENTCVRALVLDCGFCSPDELQTSIFSRIGVPKQMFILCNRLVKIKLKVDLKESTATHLAKCSLPVLFLYGEKDAVVPKGDTKRMFDACKSEKILLSVPEAGHTTALIAGGEKIQSAFYNFLNKYMEDR